MEVPMLRVKSELQLPVCTTATATRDLSHICDLQHSNARSLTHWMRPGIKPASSWILVGLATAEPQWELPLSIDFKAFSISLWTLVLGNREDARFLNCRMKWRTLRVQNNLPICVSMKFPLHCLPITCGFHLGSVLRLLLIADMKSVWLLCERGRQYLELEVNKSTQNMRSYPFNTLPLPHTLYSTPLQGFGWKIFRHTMGLGFLMPLKTSLWRW